MDVSGERRSCATSVSSARPSLPDSCCAKVWAQLGWIATRTRSIALKSGSSSVSGTPTARHPSTTSLRSEEHTSELQSRLHLVCRLLLEKKKQKTTQITGRQQPAAQTAGRRVRNL